MLVSTNHVPLITSQSSVPPVDAPPASRNFTLGFVVRLTVGANVEVERGFVDGVTVVPLVLTETVGAKVERLKANAPGITASANFGAKVVRVSEAVDGTGTAKPVGEPVANGFLMNGPRSCLNDMAYHLAKPGAKARGRNLLGFK